ncbi:uncharacterized protein [Nicotiana tomentosiformis]|uniref:uncharacterized protein n=1 Tax=Nicotiana tomentosiformis TaxID=4098 RepID=UPI00388CDF45
MRQPFPRCAQCGKKHARQCLMGLGVCYTCGYPRHVMRDCPTKGGASIVKPARSIAGSSSLVRLPGQGSQAPIGRGIGRGRASSSSSPQNRIYALTGRQDQESSPDVITGEGIQVDTQKIEAVKTWHRPTTPTEVRNFLGLAGLRRQVLGETHYSRYSVHPGATKMCHDIREIYWWDGIKKDIAEFVSQCSNCQDPSRIVPVHDVQVTKQLSYEEAPIAILDRQVRRLRTKNAASVRVLWRNNNMEEMTWEAEEDLKSRYPHLFLLPEEDQTETSQP